MIALQELISMLPENFTPKFSKRINQLYDFIVDHGADLSEEEAAQLFLRSPNKGKYFNKLKNELKRELIYNIISNPSMWLDAAYKNQHNDCYKNFTAYKILLMSGKRKAAIEMAKLLLPKLRKHELHGLINIVATDLRFHYSSMDISKHLAEKYNQLCMKQNKIIRAESIIRYHHSKVAVLRNSRASYTEDMIQMFKYAAQKTLPYLHLKSNYLNRFIYNILLSQFTATFDYKNIIITCDEALASIPKDYQNRLAMRFTYLQMKFPAMVAIGRLKKAKLIAKESCNMMPEGSFNWHLALIRRITLCLHVGDNQEAYELHKVHMQHACDYTTLSEYRDIIWGYIYFLIKVGKIEEQTIERFHLGKFLNDIPMYSKDKTGQNINLFIIQIIIRIQRQQFGQIIDRIDSLRSYVRTYTKNPETVRANIFLNMILRMEAASFHRAATERKTEKLLERLKNTPIRLGQNLAIEIIPYEMLWEEILFLLENKFRAIRGPRVSRS